MLISELLSRNADEYPDETALVELNPGKNIRESLTWREFDERANIIADALISRGIKKGDKVVHLMVNSIDWLVVYFGIIRTGAWVVPLNFRFTAEEIGYCVDIAEAKALFFGKEFEDRIAKIKDDIGSVNMFVGTFADTPNWAESLSDFSNGAKTFHPEVTILPHDVCGLYFTSGTTGVPKPIVLTHRNMEFSCEVEWQHHKQQHDDCFILIPPLYHTGAKMHWFGSLITGSKTVILTEINPKAILDAVDREKGTIVWLLVPWAQDILLALDRGDLKLTDYDLSGWRLMHIGAQPVPPSLVQHWREYFPDMLYDTNYGLSECTGPGCIHLGIENIHKVGAIGKSGYGWEVRIVDDDETDVSQGENGEIIIKGDGVMREYYKNPEMTAKTINDGWLHTGDIARMDEDGFIWITDRKKDLIITGGENIFPVEIEDVLQSHPGIYDAAVIGVPDERLGEITAAIIDPKPGIILSEQEVIDYCVERLAHYKRPRKVFFDKVPRNPTGKIEKPVLRKKYRQTLKD